LGLDMVDLCYWVVGREEGNVFISLTLALGNRSLRRLKRLLLVHHLLHPCSRRPQGRTRSTKGPGTHILSDELIRYSLKGS